MKSNDRETIIPSVALQTYYFACKMKRNMHFELVCIYFACIKHHSDIKDNSLQFSVVRRNVPALHHCKWEKDFTLPSEMHSPHKIVLNLFILAPGYKLDV